jgi:hypothetical protein
MNGNISENKDMLAIIYLDVCNLTVGNLKIGQKGLIWIISVWVGERNTLLVAIPKGTKFSIKIGIRDVLAITHKRSNFRMNDKKLVSNNQF